MGAKRAIVIHDDDNVATAVEGIETGDEVSAELNDRIQLLVSAESIPFGFKISLADIGAGGVIVKYGQLIGKATTDIAKGSLVHVHNVEGTRGRGDLEEEVG